MRLTKIKLSGFKSFVEPTTIAFPSNLTSIIGPNGCGKSNVIDAVRWVMGESSAKQLRGESMDDVIFNGSAGRPPVSRASIDLHFDNSDGSLGGQYAQYSEILIRREITREGQSNYYLNGTRCRRRDISDIFMGTGLGPRSYAIIEQGMISKIIDAKPEELRVYLEEAAGISKYKERRRETETRIRHTKENLDRLNDLREEIEKQLNHLQRQAKAAERYKTLKEEERRLKAELLALKWRELDNKVTNNDKLLQEKQTKVEASIADQRSVEAALEKRRQDYTEANESLNQVQSEYYKLGSEISRTEQNIQHYEETRQRLEQDLAQIDKAWKDASAHIEDDKAKLEDLNRDMADKTPEYEGLKQTQEQSSTRLAEAEKAMRDWQVEWEDFNRQTAEVNQIIEVESARKNQLKEQVERLNQRKDRVDQELQSISMEALQSEVEELMQSDAKATRDADTIKEQLEQSNNTVHSARETIESETEQLDVLRNKTQQVRERLVSLEALQLAALGKQDEVTNRWLEQQGFAKQPRLAESIQVASGWEKAVETVLGSHLEAVCITGIDNVASVLGSLQQGALTFIDSSSANNTAASENSLLNKINTPLNIDGFLTGVYAVETLEAALQLRQNLKENESVVTQDGLWMGQSWVRVKRGADNEGGVLAREQEINQLKEELTQLKTQLTQLEEKLSQSKDALKQCESDREAVQQAQQEAHAKHAEIHAQLNSTKARLEQLMQRKNALSQELQEVNSQIDNDLQQQNISDEKYQSAKMQFDANDTAQQQLTARREGLDKNLSEARERAQADRDALHAIALSIEAMKSAQDSTDRGLERMQQQIAHLQQRKEELTNALNTDDHESVGTMRKNLENLLESRLGLDKELGEARTQVEIVEVDIRSKESERTALEQRVQEMRNAFEEYKMTAQETRVRCQTVKEQLDETGFTVQALFEEMEEAATAAAWSEKLEVLEKRIQRMGPINLAAIDECKEKAERKEYLDAQHEDLVTALTTLEDAIAKIDKETRSRFKETFDQVNARITEMFPKLFGGGRAYLEMTGSDLLNTGVSIMAKPPGKRISNIHLMSGGEKALTAVAMVFAIFELNPAPFCMLDEVDAPLDEANVGRFCALVKEMSKQVQFIVITHNKTTMEMAEQLSGVTMREPGVSRLVAVDIDEAVQMAAAS